MPDSGLHFAQPFWLWGLLMIPVVLAWLKFSAPYRQRGLEGKYADAELLPHLSGAVTVRRDRNTLSLFGWILAWALLSLAMAGPRWGFRQINPFQTGVDLVILLDISRSMDVTDVPPSRLGRARQEIQDLIRAKRGIRMGLIAFASIAHVVTPITEDGESMLRQLPALSTQLVRLQGSRFSDALIRAETLFAAQDEDVAHNILLISDGDFAEPDIERKVQELHANGTRLHVLAVGTSEGAQVPGLMATNRRPVVSKMDKGGLRRIAAAGGGTFRVADYREDDTDEILDKILSQASARKDERIRTRVWNEYFYWLLVPAMLILLLMFRPGGDAAHLGRGGGG